MNCTYNPGGCGCEEQYIIDNSNNKENHFANNETNKWKRIKKNRNRKRRDRGIITTNDKWESDKDVY